MKTKSLVLMVALAAIISTNAFSQFKFALGVKAGPNFASINAHDAGQTYKNRTGWHGGAFMLFKFSKIGIQPEVLFSQQGANIQYSNQKVDFSYVNVPIIIKLYTVLGINLQIGPQFGFLSNSPTIKDPQNQSGQDLKNAYKKSDVSAALGVGWDLPLGITLDARYNLGLTKINDNAKLSSTTNQVWQVSVGYKLIKLGK